jgi:DNA-binding SARP family transcriptional activator
VARYGTLEDASILREYDQSPTGRAPRKSHLKKLIRRVSPTVRVHDLGPTNYEVGARQVPLTETRRKAATLLLFLVSRPRLTATKEQVMEALWPDQAPKSAINSLHQTLFFLRRDIEPWYEDGSTADYVRMEGDLVFLDNDLFQVDSVAFNRQVTEIMRKGLAREQGPEMLRLYRGRFAPEFEYEEWAEEWRAQLHGAYLHLAHTTVTAQIQMGLLEQAVDVLVPVTAIDPLAFELRASLIHCLAALGSVDAAQAHYKSMAALHLKDLGVRTRPYDDIVKGLPL